MPTPGGLPKAGEVWELTRKLPPDWKPVKVQVVVLERGSGSYWSLRVAGTDQQRRLWVDASYYFSQGELRYIGVAGPKTRQKLGIG